MSEKRLHTWEHAPICSSYSGFLYSRWLCLQCGLRRMIRAQRAPWCRPPVDQPLLPTYDALAAEVAAYRAMLAEFA